MLFMFCVCVLIHIWTKGEVSAPCPPVKYFYWPFQGGTSFVEHLCYLCLEFEMLSRLVVT